MKTYGIFIRQSSGNCVYKFRKTNSR